MNDIKTWQKYMFDAEEKYFRIVVLPLLQEHSQREVCRIINIDVGSLQRKLKKFKLSYIRKKEYNYK